MANSIYLGGGIKSAFCGGNVKEIWQGTNKLFPSGGDFKFLSYFNNFNLETKEDTPLIGEKYNLVPHNNKGPSPSISTTTYNGVEYPMLLEKIANHANEIPNLDVYSLEALIYLGTNRMEYGWLGNSTAVCYTNNVGVGIIIHTGPDEKSSGPIRNVVYNTQHIGTFHRWNDSPTNRVVSFSIVGGLNRGTNKSYHFAKVVDNINKKTRLYVDGVCILTADYYQESEFSTELFGSWNDYNNGYVGISQLAVREGDCSINNGENYPVPTKPYRQF